MRASPLSTPPIEWKDIHKWIIRHSDEKADPSELFAILRTNTVNDYTPVGSSPLHLAVLGKQKYVLSYLLPISTDIINHQNKDGCTALHFACRSGNIDNVYLLLKKGASGDIADNENNTPLHYAVECGHLQIVKYLVMGRFCDSEAENSEGRSPLDVACKEGELEIASFLIALGASIYKTLIKSIRRNHPRTILLIAKQGKANWSLLHDENSRNPLHIAVLHNRFQITHILLKRYPEWAKEKDNNGLIPAEYLHEFSDSRLASLFAH